MLLIPVLDVKDGVVVHAKLGLRNQYLPMQSPLCASCALKDVIGAFLNLHPFKIFYLADLNAITGNGNHERLVGQLLEKYPQIMFWVDSGYQAQPGVFFAQPNYQAVLGSESYGDDNLAALLRFEKNFILSLDFSTQQSLGSAQLFSDKRLWPEKIIVMTLARVGSYLGVDFEKLLYYQQLAQDKTWVAAGGIRDKHDVFALQKIGISAALCASALHSGAITAADFAHF
jgi:phosphoribosylformimino-5-aminoimidazole carboxamide ribotide isomerase